MSNIETFDFVVLGGGDAGLTAAHHVSQANRRVAVVDPGPIGGLCSRAGCKPKKTLVRATDVLDEIRHAREHGIHTDNVDIDWSRVIDRKERFASGTTAEATTSLADAGIELFQGYPEFCSRSRLAVNDRILEFEGVLISTGSSPRQLTFSGAEHAITTDEFLDLRAPPSRMVVIGAGFSAFEFGQVAARLGAEVHLLHPGSQPLKREDSEMVDALVEFSQSLGIEVWDNTDINRITPDDSDSIVEVDTPDGERRWQADVVLNAAGRTPNLDGLQLEAADIEANGNGVRANEFLRSPSNHRIFTAGDAHDGYQYMLCTLACQEGRIAARNYLEDDVESMDYQGVPQVVYTEPPLASVGLTEQKAEDQERDVDIVRAEMENLGPYKLLGETEGRAKLLFDTETSCLLGAHLYGSEAGENIHLFAIGVRLNLTREQLNQLAFACPTRASSLLCTVGQYRGKGTTPH